MFLPCKGQERERISVSRMIMVNKLCWTRFCQISSGMSRCPLTQLLHCKVAHCIHTQVQLLPACLMHRSDDGAFNVQLLSDAQATRARSKAPAGQTHRKAGQQGGQHRPRAMPSRAPGYPGSCSDQNYLGSPHHSYLPNGPLFPSLPAPDPMRGRG